MLLDSSCVKNELRYHFEIGDMEDLEWFCYVKSTRWTIEKMKDKLETILGGHYGLSFTVLATKIDPKGNVLKIVIVS